MRRFFIGENINESGVHGRWESLHCKKNTNTLLVFMINFVEPYSWGYENGLDAGDKVLAVNEEWFQDFANHDSDAPLAEEDALSLRGVGQIGSLGTLQALGLKPKERDRLLTLRPAEWLVDVYGGKNRPKSPWVVRTIYAKDGRMGLQVRWDAQLCVFEVLRVVRKGWGFRAGFRPGEQILASNRKFFYKCDTLGEAESLLQVRPATLLINTEYAVPLPIHDADGDDASKKSPGDDGPDQSAFAEIAYSTKILGVDDLATGLSLVADDTSSTNGEVSTSMNLGQTDVKESQSRYPGSLVITGVAEGSWAWHVGLSKGDRIIALDGKRFISSDNNSPYQNMSIGEKIQALEDHVRYFKRFEIFQIGCYIIEYFFFRVFDEKTAFFNLMNYFDHPKLIK